MEVVEKARRLVMRLGLATYNIHSCIGGDGRYDPERILRVIRELDADIIALQEVDSREHRGLELMQWLAYETDLHAIPGPTLLRQTGKYGNALLHRCRCELRWTCSPIDRHSSRARPSRAAGAGATGPEGCRDQGLCVDGRYE